jgi:hypothetical protein
MKEVREDGKNSGACLSGIDLVRSSVSAGSSPALPTTEICPRCKGEGVIKYKALDDLCHYSWIPWSTKDCQACGNPNKLNRELRQI